METLVNYKTEKFVEQYTTDFYLKQLPVAQAELDIIAKNAILH
jgi:hypothetical protein